MSKNIYLEKYYIIEYYIIMLNSLVSHTNNLCGPAYIYFIFAFWSFVFLLARMISSGKFVLSPAVLQLSFSYVIVFVLNWFCINGWENFSWFLLYWMFAFILIMLIGTFVLMNKLINQSQNQIQN